MKEYEKAAAGEKPAEEKRQIKEYGCVYDVEICRGKIKKVKITPVGVGMILERERELG